MSLKELRPLMVQAFCVIVTMVILGKFLADTFLPNLELREAHNGDTGEVLLMGLIGSLSFLVFYSVKDLSLKEMLVRIIIHLVITTPVLWFLYWKWEWFPMETLQGKITAAVVCVISYIVLFGGIFLKELNEANKMNLALNMKRKAQSEEHE